MNKVLYRITMNLIKILPMLTAFGYMINTILSYIGIDISILSYICGMSLFPLIFMYLCSYVFKFCAYHRMFLHYVLIVNSINIYDYYIGISLDDRSLFTFHMVLSCIVLFTITYLKFKR